MRKIILASTSPRRKELLEQIGLEFLIEPSGYEEDMNQKMSPEELARFLSHQKALDVAEKHKGEDSLVIGADTFIAFEGGVLGKPHTAEKAKEMLSAMSGKAHSVLSGFTIIDTKDDKIISKAVETRVYFRDLSEEEINAYIASGEPLDRAGAYEIQGLGGLLVDKIEGDYTNIVGLPVTEVALALKEFGVNILK